MSIQHKWTNQKEGKEKKEKNWKNPILALKKVLMHKGCMHRNLSHFNSSGIEYKTIIAPVYLQQTNKKMAHQQISASKKFESDKKYQKSNSRI